MTPIIIPDSLALLPLATIPFPYAKEDFAGVLIPASLIASQIKDVVDVLMQDFVDQEPHFLWVADGAKPFFDVLAAAYAAKHTSSQIKVSSYENETSTGRRNFSTTDFSSLVGRHVIIVEDIVDTGGTMVDLTTRLHGVGVASTMVVSLLDKRLKNKSFHPHIALFSIPDVFVVGFGLDYNQRFRDLDAVYLLSAVAKEKYCS